MRKLGVVLALAVVAAMVGCGSSGDTTTVIRETPAETVERTTTVEAPAPRPKPVAERPAPEPEPAPEPKEAPDVVGLPLDVAEKLLRGAGYQAEPTNTDTTFGIIDPSNYTVCTQDDPRGKIVVMLAQKYGC